jgi:hypothetical protein
MADQRLAQVRRDSRLVPAVGERGERVAEHGGDQHHEQRFACHRPSGEHAVHGLG